MIITMCLMINDEFNKNITKYTEIYGVNLIIL